MGQNFFRMSLIIANFTKTFLENLEIDKNKILHYRDIKKDLSLYITQKGSKTFYIRKSINKKNTRIILGNFPDISLEEAIKKSLEAKNAIANGINPKDKKKEADSVPTFEKAFNDFLEKYALIHKKSVSEDERRFKRFSKVFKETKISQITKDDIQKIHSALGKENGKYEANRVLQLISAIYSKAIFFGVKTDNPAQGIQKFKEKSRDRFLQNDEIKTFFKTLNTLKSQTMKDYVLMSLFTGARKANILSMQWQDINFNQAKWVIKNSKNGEDLNIPLSLNALEILESRKNNNSIYVFSSATSKYGHFKEPKTSWKTLLKKAKIENLRLHDLRRTLGSYLQMTGTDLHGIGLALGHKSHQATQVYARTSLDATRERMTKATDKILEFAEIDKKN